MQDILDKLRMELNEKVTRRDRLQQEKEETQKELDDLKLDEFKMSLGMLQKLSANKRELATRRLEELATQALRYSLNQNRTVKIEFEENRKRPQAFLKVIDNETGIETDPIEENGGGIIDIISVALRIIMLENTFPDGVNTSDGPIILDEPFKMLSVEYIPLASNFLKKISKDFNRQIILISHNAFLKESADKKINMNDIINY